jgi:two-component system NtrC family sensor kinase
MRAQLVQTEKLAAMGRLVASVAHELNNPLQAIQNSLYLVSQENELNPQSREDLQVALTEADRMAALISRLRETYRPATAEQFRYESLNSIIDEVQKLIGTHLRHNNVRFSFEAELRLPKVPSLRDQLKQVILNLCLNAVEAMPQGGELRLHTEHLSKQGEVLVTIQDTGDGIDPVDLRNIFEPFFTTKEGGTGLGLFITHEIIQRHQGRVEVESELGKGATFRVWLPVTRTEMSDTDPGGRFDSK